MEATKTKETLGLLKLKLEKIEAFSAATISFQKKRFSKEVQEYVRKEISEFIDKKISEIDGDVEKKESNPSQFTEEETRALKALASKVGARPEAKVFDDDDLKSDPSNPTPDVSVHTMPQQLTMTEALRMNAELVKQRRGNKMRATGKLGSSTYKGQDVEVLAKVGATAVIRGADGNKIKVPIAELR